MRLAATPNEPDPVLPDPKEIKSKATSKSLGDAVDAAVASGGPVPPLSRETRRSRTERQTREGASTTDPAAAADSPNADTAPAGAGAKASSPGLQRTAAATGSGSGLGASSGAPVKVQSWAAAKKALARATSAKAKALKFIEAAKKRERIQEKARRRLADTQEEYGPITVRVSVQMLQPPREAQCWPFGSACRRA